MNDSQSTMSFRQSKNYTFGMQGGNPCSIVKDSINTPSKRLQSPKVGPSSSNIISSRKLNSSSRLHDALLNASSSRKSISSPKTAGLANPFKDSRPLQPPSSYFDKPYANLLQDYQLPPEFSVPQINAPSMQLQNSQRDFRISNNKSKPVIPAKQEIQKENVQANERLVQKRQVMVEEQKKTQQERQQIKEKIKKKLKVQDEQEQAEGQMIMQGQRVVLEALDWKESQIYQDYVIKRLNNRLLFEKAENNLMREDELDFVKMMVAKKVKDQGGIDKDTPDLLKLCEPLAEKCLNSLKVLLKELLTDKHYKTEFSLIQHSLSPLTAAASVNALAEKCRKLFILRDDAITFLIKVQEREQILQEMRQTVMNLTNDEEIEQNYSKVAEAKPSREKIKTLGDLLVDITDEVIRGQRRFVHQFGQAIEGYELKTFNYILNCLLIK